MGAGMEFSRKDMAWIQWLKSEGIIGRFTTPEKFIWTFRNKSALGFRSLYTPTFFTPERLAEIVKTHPSARIRNKALDGLGGMYDEIIWLGALQSDKQLSIKAPNPYTTVITDRIAKDSLRFKEKNKGIPFKGMLRGSFRRRGRIEDDFLTSWRERIMAQLEDILLFGNYLGSKDSIIKRLILSSRGKESIRRILIDDFGTESKRIAMRLIRYCMGFPNPHRSKKVQEILKKIYNHHSQVCRIENIWDGNLRTMRELNRRGGGITEPAHLDDWSQFLDKCIVFEHKSRSPFGLRFEEDMREQLGKAGRHTPYAWVARSLNEFFADSRDIENLMTTAMRGEKSHAQEYATVNLLLSIMKKAKKAKEYKHICMEEDTERLKLKAHYAAIRCANEDTVNLFLIGFAELEDSSGIAKMAAYSKLRSARMLAAHMLRNDTRMLAEVVTHANMSDSAEASLKLLTRSVKNDQNKLEDLRRALKRPSPSIGKPLLKEARALLMRR